MITGKIKENSRKVALIYKSQILCVRTDLREWSHPGADEAKQKKFNVL